MRKLINFKPKTLLTLGFVEFDFCCENGRLFAVVFINSSNKIMPKRSV